MAERKNKSFKSYMLKIEQVRDGTSHKLTKLNVFILQFRESYRNERMIKCLKTIQNQIILPVVLVHIEKSFKKSKSITISKFIFTQS